MPVTLNTFANTDVREYQINGPGNANTLIVATGTLILYWNRDPTVDQGQVYALEMVLVPDAGQNNPPGSAAPLDTGDAISSTIQAVAQPATSVVGANFGWNVVSAVSFPLGKNVWTGQGRNYEVGINFQVDVKIETSAELPIDYQVNIVTHK